MSKKGKPETEVESLDLRSHDIADDKRQELLSLFPEVRTQGDKIDFERLRVALGETVDVGKERYGLTWPGKADCFKAIQTPSIGTLRPAPEESVNFNKSENLIIEGDNLEVLKLLQKSYLGKIKMIYIDPPYNTGNDFIYPDDYTESLQTYLEYTGQVDSQGKKFNTNTDTSGRFHSNWLNMMYPRLYLARNLLREDGVIFISIDDTELENLRRLCNEIFGEEAFLASFVWRRRPTADSRNLDRASTDHEYVIAYKGPIARLEGRPIDTSKYANPDDDPRGPWTSANLTGLATKEQRPNLHYDVVNSETGITYPPSSTRGWAVSQETMARLIAENRILWPKSKNGRPRLKQFLREVRNTQTGFSTLLDVGTTNDGTRAIQDLFEDKVFPFSKPVKLLTVLVEQTTSRSDIILDFFAGSGTTGHAVLKLNAEDGGNRKFILVQLPEPTGREDFVTLADICKERVRRVIDKLDKEDAGRLGADDTTQDRGFRIFRLDESNFKPWQADASADLEAFQSQLELHVEHVRDDRSEQDILYELLLKSGFPLTTTVDEIRLAGKNVFRIGDGAFLICLEKDLSLDLIRAMAEAGPERVVCLDAGFNANDQLKANAAQIFKTKGVTSFRTV